MSTYCYSIGSDGRHTSSVIVGNSPNLHGWVRSDVYFHRFADSKPGFNQYVTSPSFSCFGRSLTILQKGITNVAFIPVSSACRTLHNLSINKDSADVVFEVKGDKDTSPKSKFYAHRLILRTAAPQLAELCLTDGSQSLVEIPNISSATFEVLLFYIYGGKGTNFGEDIAEVKILLTPLTST